MLNVLAVANYRSLRSLLVPLRGLNVITGTNGSGKSSVYRSLRLLADNARGALVPSLAREGGLNSTLWAGPENISRGMRRGEVPVQGTGKRNEPVNLKLGFAGEEYGYSVELGLPTPAITAFGHDPQIKRECIWHGPVFRRATLLADRHNSVVTIHGGKAVEPRVVTTKLSPFDSMLAQLADPRSAPEALLLREQIRSWRFYDHFRTDAEAPARLPQVGTYTPVLSNDGADLAAALQTIAEIGDREALAEAVHDAFPGGRIEIQTGSRFEVAMHQHGLLRPLSAAELSDGTLRYLLWIAALLTPRPPGLLVLNEPETSLHPDLLPALGRLIAQAAKHTQVIVVSHARRLIASLEEAPDCNSLMLEKELGETRVADSDALDMPAWQWPPR